MVDLPPEEAKDFRDLCTSEGWALLSILLPPETLLIHPRCRLSYIPLIAPSTSESRIQFLASIADSFLYIVSKMGTTGANKGRMNAALPDLLSRVRQFTQCPLAVGFGIATREHLENVIEAGADGGVVGSKIVSVIQDGSTDASETAERVRRYVSSLTGRGDGSEAGPIKSPVAPPTATPAVNATQNTPALSPPAADSATSLPARFGQFGGQYVPEALVDCLVELEAAHKAALADPSFWQEFESFFGYMNRPSRLYLAERLSKEVGGANIWFKREDLSVDLGLTTDYALLISSLTGITLAHTKLTMPSVKSFSPVG
jgi:tryptophan synthase